MGLEEKLLISPESPNLIKEIMPPEAIEKIARDIVETSLKIKPQEKVLIFYDTGSQPLVEKLEKLCQGKEAQVDFYQRDFEKEIEIVRNGSQEEIDTYFQEQKEKMDQADKLVLARALENPELRDELSDEENKIYMEKLDKIHRRRFEGKLPWLLIDWPTFYDAKKEGLTIQEYCREYLKACDQPWAEIKKAQAKLIEKLNKGEKLQIIVNENDPDEKKRTNLTMSLKEMTFINCTIDWNYPGSEVFSAPVLDSVNGHLFAPGEFLYEGTIFKNLYFDFKDGEIIEAYAEENNEKLQLLLDRDSVNRFIGEIALGTNPGITRSFKEELLGEKRIGSFHITPGEPYEDEFDADGLPVKVNNGNKGGSQAIHWDIVVSMYPEYGGGKVILDEEIIQENGRFLDTELAILNPKLESN
jgi:aminopeptidase